MNQQPVRFRRELNAIVRRIDHGNPAISPVAQEAAGNRVIVNFGTLCNVQLVNVDSLCIHQSCTLTHILR